MAQGGKRLLLGEQVLRVPGRAVPAGQRRAAGDRALHSSASPARARPRRWAWRCGRQVDRPAAAGAPAAAGRADAAPAAASPPATPTPELLDAVVRLLRLLDRPADAPCSPRCRARDPLAAADRPARRRWSARSAWPTAALSLVGRAIRVDPRELRRADPDRRPGRLSRNERRRRFNRHFRAVTAMSPLQYQKQLRLQEARLRCWPPPGDVAARRAPRRLRQPVPVQPRVPAAVRRAPRPRHAPHPGIHRGRRLTDPSWQRARRLMRDWRA